jgi:hypothetical protein
VTKVILRWNHPLQPDRTPESLRLELRRKEAVHAIVEFAGPRSPAA